MLRLEPWKKRHCWSRLTEGVHKHQHSQTITNNHYPCEELRTNDQEIGVELREGWGILGHLTALTGIIQTEAYELVVRCDC